MALSEKKLERLIPDYSNHLITGPPGSGKTHTLIQLVKYITSSRNIDPTEILIFSFNRKWSKILREQTVFAIDRSLWEIPIETFYSFCIDILGWAKLKKYCKDRKRLRKGEKAQFDHGAGIDILNSVEQWNILTRIVKSLSKRDYPYTCRYINSNEHVAGSFIQEVFDFILRAQENLMEPEVLLKRFVPWKHPLMAELSGVYSRYNMELTKNGKYNYGMLLLETVRLLEEDKTARKHFRDKYKFVMVDEFQEANTAQFRIINSIVDNNCIFFGNDDQAIYSFRGAVTDNFKNIYRKLKGQGKVFFLGKNHRSSGDIVKITDSFISINKDRVGKENIACRKDGEGEVSVRNFSTVHEEVAHICQKIEQLRKDRDVKLEEMAILVKGLGYETHLIEDALAASGLQFVRRGTRNILDNRHVSYIISFLKLVSVVGSSLKVPYNKSGILKYQINKGMLLESILLSDTVNIEPLFFSKLKSSFKKECERENLDFWTYINDYLKDKKETTLKEEKLFKENLSQILGKIFYYSKKKDIEILDFLLDFLDDPIVGLFKFFDKNKVNDENGRSISISVGDYLKSVMKYVHGSLNTDIESYLRFIENIEANQFLEEVEEGIEEQVQPGMINILSFHQCKGLEYDAVFIPFINDGYLPSKFRNQQSFDVQVFRTLSEGIGFTPTQIKKEHMDGEARLFYNGLTRAKRYLYVTSCRSKTSSVFFKKIRSSMDIIEEDISENKKRAITVLPNKEWMLKKRSLIAFYRMESGLKIDTKHVLSTLRELKEKYPPSKWWNLSNTTLNKNVPLDILKRPFSYTGLETYRNCPFKYKIRYFFGISSKESIGLSIGRLYHKILQRFFNEASGDYTWERLKRVTCEVFERQELGFPSMRQEIISGAISDFKRYYKNYLPGKPKLSSMEKRFRFEHDDSTLEGRIDQINIGSDGNVELVDFKSGSHKYNNRELFEEIQLKIYRLAVEKDRHFKDISNSSIKMKYIFLGAKKDGEIFLPCSYFDREKILGQIDFIISRITGEDFHVDPKSYITCSFCDYKILCPRFYGKNN